MTPPMADIVALRRQLGAEIGRALRTSEDIGATLVSCHLQMALDVLGDFVAAAAAGPHHDSTGRVQGR